MSQGKIIIDNADLLAHMYQHGLMFAQAEQLIAIRIKQFVILRMRTVVRKIKARAPQIFRPINNLKRGKNKSISVTNMRVI